MNKEFEVHMLNEQGRAKARTIANAFDRLLDALTDDLLRQNIPELDGFRGSICPPGRELSIVKTKLEEACFFAKKAMASQPENCEP